MARESERLVCGLCEYNRIVVFDMPEDAENAGWVWGPKYEGGATFDMVWLCASCKEIRMAHGC